MDVMVWTDSPSDDQVVCNAQISKTLSIAVHSVAYPPIALSYYLLSFLTFALIEISHHNQ